MEQNEWTFAEAMKTAGYATAVYGKWHLGYSPRFHPMHHGFDEFKGFISGNIDAHSHYDRKATFDWWQGQERKDEPGYHTDLITNHTLDFIERHQDKPFFVYLAHGTPHSPHQARGSKIQRGPRKGEVPQWGKGEPAYSKTPGDDNWLMRHFVLPVDEGLGRIRQRIVDLGMAENTIIWFISDNGGTGGNKTTSPKTRGSKGSLYEGGHRVPGIVWAPGRVQPGKSAALIMGIMPTSMALSGVNAPKDRVLDGIDVGPALFNKQSLPARPVLWGTDEKKLALRDGPWKLAGKELFNLDQDPQEKSNVAKQYPKKVKAMTEKRMTMFKEFIADSPHDQ